MANIKIETTHVSPIMTNCYLVINLDSGELILIDPGDNAPGLIESIDDSGLALRGILLTHGHFDHAGAANEIADHFGVSVYAHEKEAEVLSAPSLNLSGGMMGRPAAYKADRLLKDDEEVTLGGMTFKTLYTPGHTVGGCSFYFPEAKAVFAGDTLFCGSVGRTDFPGGSMSVLSNSIREKLYTLPGDTVVYPGHDSITTIDQEKENNPFVPADDI
ncbi:MAG: MBL fold metallo-hydrolase [Lachnospiraceae bacterium]|nr:MBL fold metallo-hydrolase [Lachnospiraceae bacterium]